nr:GntR family transcriptional regulator [Chloroflexota bacterium]
SLVTPSVVRTVERQAWEQGLARPVMLTRGADQPVYRQLQDLIRGSITSGAWTPGSAIPTEKVFAQQFGVARMTVRQALDGLIRDGLLLRVRGRGTFVTQPRVERELTRMHSFTEDMRDRGMIPSTRLLTRQVIPAPDEVGADLCLGRREAVIMLQRLRFADALPMALETSYLNYERCQPVLDADLEAGSLYHFLETHLRFPLSHATQELEASLPDKAEAELLRVSRRQPMLVIRQTTYIRGPVGEEPVIRGRTVYRADRYRFQLEVPR